MISHPLSTEINSELRNILSYWEINAIDKANGGFYGTIGANNKPQPFADKGVILNTRILWTFSTAYNFYKEEKYEKIASVAYDYLVGHFIDRKNGGVFWMLDYKGNPVNTRKQIYAQAFAIYAFTEYFHATKNPEVLEKSIEIFELIEKHSFDRVNGGYIEAFSEKWGLLEDLRLSEKEENVEKTMNTHLHVLEAYTSLYRAWKNDTLRSRLIMLIDNFRNHIVNSKSYHLDLFFDANWYVRSQLISYGHDIEASWLLYEAAEVLDDEAVMGEIAALSLKIANAASEGLDTDGGLMNELSLDTKHLDSDKHWWPQAEAMVGLLNAYQISDEKKYFALFMSSWNFIDKFIIDHENGEWFWRVDKNGIPYDEGKAGFWKCPYHNSRACIEVLRRIKMIDMPGEFEKGFRP
ncbi:MAG: AGE family epimerase/isomerase [Bacteroidales bacterium]|nr:AGE family epimerase/isomerase [Bacteroidales bacterium]